jgi:hypothetical protein
MYIIVYWLYCRYMTTLGNKRVELFDMGAGVSEPTADDNVQVASGEIYLSLIHRFVPTCLTLPLRAKGLLMCSLDEYVFC